MNVDSELARDLERAVPHLPSAPATDYLAVGRRARRRRRALASAAGVAVLALFGGAALTVLDDPASNSVVGTPATGADDIPDWAEEYGSHGPVSIYPDGELWVAPDARLIRSVEIPAGTFEQHVISAYVTESEFEGDVWWSVVYRTSSAPRDHWGQMEPAGEWTTDFDLWVDYITADLQGRPRFSDRLVQFAGPSSEQLVPLLAR